MPSGFAEGVNAEVAAIDPETSASPRVDATHLPLIAVDPPGARDLDQALHIERSGSGYRLHYCIADVGALVQPGGAIDLEARARAVTVYLPDAKVPLHPPQLSEGFGSLLPDGQRRPAIWWEICFEENGEMLEASARRAWVRASEAISYAEAQRRIDEGDEGSLGLLAELGPLRQKLEVQRGGISLELPEQIVDVAEDGSASLRFDQALPIQGWNAQLSLATGMAAAKIMTDAGVGILRTMPPPEDFTLGELRQISASVGVAWPGTYAEWVRSLDPQTPVGLALLNSAAKGLRGAGYTSFDGTPPEIGTHAAVAAPYAHVTAPLRRLVDRFANEVVLAVSAGERPPDWVLEALPQLPALMATGDRLARKVDRAVVDLMEAAVLSQRVGDPVEGVSLGETKGGTSVQLVDPPVLTTVKGLNAAAGERVTLLVKGADLGQRTVSLGRTSAAAGGSGSADARGGQR